MFPLIHRLYNLHNQMENLFIDNFDVECVKDTEKIYEEIKK